MNYFSLLRPALFGLSMGVLWQYRPSAVFLLSVLWIIATILEMLNER
jgi:hypothetical protein